MLMVSKVFTEILQRVVKTVNLLIKQEGELNIRVRFLQKEQEFLDKISVSDMHMLFVWTCAPLHVHLIRELLTGSSQEICCP